MRRILSIVAWILVLLIASTDAWAQATAQIAGTVKDQTGAVLPGVEVTVTQIDTGTTRNAVTNETGSYVLSNLPIGPYRLEAALPGFRTYAQTGIVLQVNSSPVVNPVLEVGQVSEQVEVQANATLVETRSAGVGQVVENARILELPLNGRQVVELLALSGAATPAPTVTGSNRDPFARGNVSVAGGLGNGLNYTLDGANHNNQYSGSYLSFPFPDALQEFKVETSATSAQSGVKSSGTVSLVTKSGTNTFHGNLFEFVRNGIFNARNAFATKRDTIKRNQYGGTVGGAILKNKLFFFAGYQGTKVRQDPPDTLGFVPTTAMFAGDFTTFASPACNTGRQMTLRAPFVNNRIDPALFSKAAVAFAKLLPSTTDPCGRIIYSNPSRQDGQMAVGRIDYQKSEKHSLFGRYLIESAFAPPAYDLNKNLLSVGTGDDGLSQAFTIGSTYLFRPNVVNALRLSANRFAGGKTQPDFKDCNCGPAGLGIKMFSYEPLTFSLTVTGGWSIASANGPSRMAIFAASDDLSIVRGNHQFAVGASGSSWWSNNYTTTQSKSTFQFNGQTTGLGMADFFTGDVSLFRNGAPSEQHNRSKYVGLYAADTWKLNQKLTLNYGVRWEPYLPQVNLDRSAIHVDVDAMNKGIKTKRFDNAPPGLFFEGDPGFPGKSGMYNQWWNFSPRVGFAWDVTGDGRTSVRASAGTFYDYPTSLYLRSLTTGPPMTPRVQLTNVKFDTPWSNYPGGDPFPMPYGRDLARNTVFTPYSAFLALDYDSHNMRVGQWNLSIQRQIGSDWLTSATYLGNATRHLWGTQPLNPVIFIPGNCQAGQYGLTAPGPCSNTTNLDARRRLTLANPVQSWGFGYLNHIDTGGNASYNGLLLSVQRRAAKGVTVSANYTWSHCITELWQEAATNPTANQGWGDPDNRRYDRGNCSTAATDRRHLFNLSGVAETPVFSNPTLRAVGSGWRLSPIFKILSGGYLSLSTTTDVALNGMSAQHVSQVLGNPYGDKSPGNYLNPKAFALPDRGTLGNSGLGAIAGPGTWQLDIALSRTFQFNESQKVEFRAETFNLTNSLRMNDPVTTFNSSTFGQVTSAKDPRIMQFALKYFF
jgi:Carboxypeptidase regulatory-like domain/TonB dependent receptor